MSLTESFKVSGISRSVGNMLNIGFARKALIPSLVGGVLTGVAVFKLLADVNLNEARTLLTGYIAGGVSCSLDQVLPDVGSFDEAGQILLGGTAAGMIVNAAFGKLLPADTSGDGIISDEEKIANYNAQFTPITASQRLYASIVAGAGVSIAAYAEMARYYNV